MTTSPEHAVRRYLAWIEDPSSAVDQEAVDARLEELEAAGDLGAAGAGGGSTGETAGGAGGARG